AGTADRQPAAAAPFVGSEDDLDVQPLELVRGANGVGRAEDRNGRTRPPRRRRVPYRHDVAALRAPELVVVGPPALRVGQDVVRLGDLLEGVRRLLARDVGVHLLGEIAIRRSDPARALGARNTEDHVVRPPVHGARAPDTKARRLAFTRSEPRTAAAAPFR